MTLNNTARFLTITATSAMLLFSSCKKDNNNDQATAVTEDEAVEVMSQGVSNQSGGMAAQTESAAKVTTTSRLNCGETSDTIIAAQSLSGAVIRYNYNVEITRALTCENNVPSTFAFTYAGTNSYDAPRMSSNDNTTAAFTISGLQPSFADLTFNQTYTRNGTQQSHIRQQRQITSQLVITSSAVIVNKATQKITSGTATLQFTGQVVGGASVSYGGTLTFLGNNTGTLVLNNGNTYNLNW